MPVDMACASSIAAVHHAAAALERGEVDLALVGGVNANLSQAITRFHHELGMLSTAGRCNAFDADADGFVRGEGCGVLVLKRLSEAAADGDRIWGLVKGSAVNQNGASAGLPVPNGPAQEVVISDALARAGVAPSEVDYLEAHGTGTELGDSIELRAVSAVYGKGPGCGKTAPHRFGQDKHRPPGVGIGHGQHHQGRPGNEPGSHPGPPPLPAAQPRVGLGPNAGSGDLGVRPPGPQSPTDPRWPRLTHSVFPAQTRTSSLKATKLLQATMGAPSTWPTGPTQLVNGSIPDADGSGPSSGAGRFLTSRRACCHLSGKSSGALRDLAGAYLHWLDENAGSRDAADQDTGTTLSDMAWTTAIGRSHFDHRKAVVFNDVEQLRAGLESQSPVRRTCPSARTLHWPMRRLRSCTPGQGGQWPGMGEPLYQSEPVVRAVMDRCDRAFQEEHGESLLEVVFGGSQGNGDLSDPVWAQPAIYALECALTALWRSVGVSPSVSLGSNIGEIAAAQAAGMLSLEDGPKGSLQG